MKKKEKSQRVWVEQKGRVLVFSLRPLRLCGEKIWVGLSF